MLATCRTAMAAAAFRNIALLLCTLLFALTPGSAQWIRKQTGCYADSMAANPNRPTVADPADITQYGVLEIEYGWDNVWPEKGVHQTSSGGLLKFALFCDIELRWTTTSFLSQTTNGITQHGFGDNWIGTQVRFYRQTKRVPSMALGYAAKIPSASSDNGLGSGRVDRALTLLVSKDISKLHFDFNATQFWIGRQGTHGFDLNNEANMAFSFHIHGPLQFTGELYGDTELNRGTPGFVSSLWAFTYTVRPRLVIDSGYEAGITAGGPRRHAFVGFTYSIANLYPGWRHRKADPSH